MERPWNLGSKGSGSRMGALAAPLLLLLVLGGLHLIDLLLEAESSADRRAVGHVAPAHQRQGDPGTGSGEPPPVSCTRHLPQGAVSCGLSPPTSRTRTGVAHEVVTVAGERFRVALPEPMAPDGAVVVVQDLPLGWVADRGGAGVHLTTAAPAEAAAGSCRLPCEPSAVVRSVLPNGAVVTDWRLAPLRTRATLVTIRMGPWTATVEHVPSTIARFVAEVLEWRLEDGFLVVDSRDPTYPLYDDWAGVRIHVPSAGARYSLAVTPGCRLSGKRPNLGRADVGSRLRSRVVEGIPGGEWCAGGRYWVRARHVGGGMLRTLHDGLEVHPAGDGGPGA